MRRAARQDGNAGVIDDALLAAGCSVMVLTPREGGEPDRLVGSHGHNVLMEYKADKGKLRKKQIDWAKRWRGEKPILVRGPYDALAAMGLVG